MNCEKGAWRCPVCNKTAYLEGLEVDQYVWAILTNLSNSEVEEVTVSANACWKPVSLKLEHEQDLCGAHKKFKAMSPGSMTMPTTSSWEMGQALSPYAAMPPPDMQSIANGPTLPNGMSYRGMNGSYDFSSDFGSPLAHLNDSVASLDPLAAMEKSLNQHEQQMCPHNICDQNSQQMPHLANSSAPGTSQTQPSSSHQQYAPPTPSSTQSMMQHGPHRHTHLILLTLQVMEDLQVFLRLHLLDLMGGVEPNGINSNSNSSNPANSQPPSVTTDNPLSHAADLSDLNFDPAAVIDGEGQGQEGLNLLPESVVDPMELLSYLDPPELSSGGNSTSGITTTNCTITSTSNSTSDDILSFFDS
ncbi:zinc finger MIZ domain-containing protein 1-like [Tachypleus tridentatus]|uniref:zinc finger MIZ domain-containing protein 1-like n=1 Tax=Tachypleus tridentatus TaxID=6853 RepID=UPI003FD06239